LGGPGLEPNAALRRGGGEVGVRPFVGATVAGVTRIGSAARLRLSTGQMITVSSRQLEVKDMSRFRVKLPGGKAVTLATRSLRAAASKKSAAVRSRRSSKAASSRAAATSSQGLRISLPNKQVISLAPGQQSNVVKRAIQVATGRLQITLPNGRKFSLVKRGRG
jgi:hypothetical protein